MRKLGLLFEQVQLTWLLEFHHQPAEHLNQGGPCHIQKNIQDSGRSHIGEGLAKFIRH